LILAADVLVRSGGIVLFTSDMKKAVAIAATVCIFQILAWLALKFDVETLIIPPDAALPDGGHYYGELRDGRLHGKGKLIWADGSRYEGEFAEGLFSGKGELIYAFGDTYTGQFRNGTITQATFKSRDGSQYEGEFLNWQFHGKGVYTTPEGVVYSGDFVTGEIVKGTYKHPDGYSYEGELRDWQFHGAGVYTLEDGSIQRGHFEQGLIDGKGSYEGKDGERYEGEFKDGYYQGQGVLTQPNGDRYTGDFEFGRPHGKGEMVYARPVDGVEKRSGEWTHGEFMEPGSEEKNEQLRQQVEYALYRQNELLETAVSSLEPGAPGAIDLYFVGFAAYGQQDVFFKELQYIRELFDSRFGTAGRSAVLINNQQTLEQTALATRVSLERALKAVAAKMNPEEDILFLYLTSHGSADHQLSIAHPGIKLPDLSASDLESMLRPLPVKWKVIAISACYAGGFIPLLENENTLVMTAASAERKSFGCSDTSEMTWFAKAYFKESLPRAASFEQAFAEARKLIAEWEQQEVEEGAENSEPQIAAGTAIAEHLKTWWQRQPPPETPLAKSAEKK
jgi:hypothetical protein